MSWKIKSDRSDTSFPDWILKKPTINGNNDNDKCSKYSVTVSIQSWRNRKNLQRILKMKHKEKMIGKSLRKVV